MTVSNRIVNFYLAVPNRNDDFYLAVSNRNADFYLATSNRNDRYKPFLLKRDEGFRLRGNEFKLNPKIKVLFIEIKEK